MMDFQNYNKHPYHSDFPVWLKKILGHCSLHGYLKYPYRYRANTAYVKEEDNFEVGCHLCQEESNYYWADAWESADHSYGPRPNRIDRKKWLCSFLNFITFTRVRD